MRKEEISFTDPALQLIIRSYTRESGVRNLEREIGTLCRKVVTLIAEEKVAEVVAMMTGVPVQRIAQAEGARLLKMAEELRGSVIGQDEAIFADDHARAETRSPCPLFQARCEKIPEKGFEPRVHAEARKGIDAP